MKFLLVTNHFHPEKFRCNDLAFELEKYSIVFLSDNKNDVDFHSLFRRHNSLGQGITAFANDKRLVEYSR